jgi:hypothetical protein
MKHPVAVLLSSAALLAVLGETPVLAFGGDARFEADQAQLHPWESNQTPNWSANDVALGEPYRAVPGRYAFYGPNGIRPLGMMTAPSAVAQ